MSEVVCPQGARSVEGEFISESGDEPDEWYCIEGYDQLPPFFISLASDSDIWAFVSTNGSLTAGRRDEDGAFFPYETVDKIHARGAHTGPRTWIRCIGSDAVELWQPFGSESWVGGLQRSIWKNLSGTRVRFRESNERLGLSFEMEWAASAELGLIRTAKLRPLGTPSVGPVRVQVLDGVLNLLPAEVGARVSATMSCLVDAYKWNEIAADGRLGVYTLYAQIWDRAEPKEAFRAVVAWHSGVPSGTKTLLSSHQVNRFCRTGEVDAESLTRGRAGAFLVNFQANLPSEGLRWDIVINGPCSQVQTFELSTWLQSGGGTEADIMRARKANSAGVDELLSKADGFQHSADVMACAHHRANVLFNIMRGGVFVDRTQFETADLLAYAKQRSRALGSVLSDALATNPNQIPRAEALRIVRSSNNLQLERLVLGYLPLTFSRRHGDPSRPWNKFSIRVRDERNQRVVNYQGNWRDIFQNWEALATSEPEYLDSMICTFLGSMSQDGYNPYRIGRDGIDWEVVDPDDPWSHIGYWGDHQVIYLLRLLEALHAHNPNRLDALWNTPLFSFADIPYRLKPHAQQVKTPKHTIEFDHAAHERAQRRRDALGADGLLVCDPQGVPFLATLGEKLGIILLAKAGSLLPGGGLWLHTQRPEWNDANNALVGNGLSVVSLAYLRRFLVFVRDWPTAQNPCSMDATTLSALTEFGSLLRSTSVDAVHDSQARRAFLDGAGALLETWRAAAYAGNARTAPTTCPQGLLVDLARDLLPLVDATLWRCQREDGLFDSYNLVKFTPQAADVTSLYPMLEGQVALLSSGLLTPTQCTALLRELFASPLYTEGRRSFLLYPDRSLPGFFERNQLDSAALSLPIVKRLLAEGRNDLLQSQSDGTVRFAPGLSNRVDLETAGRDLGDELDVLADAYERLLHHHQFTGRSGTMFAYEGLGCIYWHMVAKLLLAVQEQVFTAADKGAGEVLDLIAFYRRVRSGLGYAKSVAEYGAFPADPYSHTAAEGGAQQPGMTGQVKEEILTRWGELGLRRVNGRVKFQPVLLDPHELLPGSELKFTWAQVPYVFRRGQQTRLRVCRDGLWHECPDATFDPWGVSAVSAEVAFSDGTAIS